MDLTCSARDCRVAARWALLWNNPRVHTADRRKTWLACDEHRPTLVEFLTVRGFLRDVRPVSEDDVTPALPISPAPTPSG